MLLKLGKVRDDFPADHGTVVVAWFLCHSRHQRQCPGYHCFDGAQ